MARLRVVSKPCDYCGKEVTRTGTQASQRKYWTCDPTCANKLRIAQGSTPAWAENPLRGQQETRPCGFCGESVTRYLNPKNVGKTWYCSVKHRALAVAQHRVASGEWTRPQKPRRGDYYPCDWCGEQFYRQPAYIKENRRFCSQEHWNAAQRVNQIAKVCAYCGEPFWVARSQSDRMYCKKRCEADAKIKRPTGRTHNGRPVLENFQGYLTIYEPDHPAAGTNGRVLEHRWVMEQHLGRYLSRDEHVDHRDQNRQHNDISNLQVLDPVAHQHKTQDDRNREVRELRAKAKRLEQLEEEARRRDEEIATLRAHLKEGVLQ